MITCKDCNGRGWSNGRRAPGRPIISIICKTCGGRGKVKYAPR